MARRNAATGLVNQCWRHSWDAIQFADGTLGLRERFRRDFWMPDRGCYALDDDKRQVDSRTSNIVHVLWSGLADDEQASTIVGDLLDEPLYSGWWPSRPHPAPGVVRRGPAAASHHVA